MNDFKQLEEKLKEKLASPAIASIFRESATELARKREKMESAIYEITAAGKKSKVVGTTEMAETVKALQDHGWKVKIRKVS